MKYYGVTKEPTSLLGGRVMMNESMSYIVDNRLSFAKKISIQKADILLNQVMKSALIAIYGNLYVKEELGNLET